MDDARFDRFVRMLATRVSRRGAVGVAGTLAIAGIRGASANQLTPSTCGASGDVCTMLMGCCDGLTCVTSAINTNYGVCVAGEGGTVSIGTTLISPFSENVEQEVAAIAASETTSTTTTTDPALEREQRLAEIKARKDARRSKQKTRRTTKQSEQQNRRDDRQFARDERRGPRISVEFLPPEGQITFETVKVTNRDDVDVALTWIESFPRASATAELTLSVFTLDPGDSYRFASGLQTGEATANRYDWSNSLICDTEGETGFLVRAGFSSTSAENYEYVVLCDGSRPRSAGRGGRKKRKRNRNGGNNKN